MELSPIFLPPLTRPAQSASAAVVTVKAPKPAPSGSKPSEKGVAAIRRLNRELASFGLKLETLRREFDKLTLEFHVSIGQRIKVQIYEGTSIAELWRQYQDQVDHVGDTPYVVHDMNRESETYNAALATIAETGKERDAVKVALQEAVDAEAAKLTVALQEAIETIEAAAFEAFSRFCPESEARELMEQTQLLTGIRAAQSTWMSYGSRPDSDERAPCFLSALKQLETCLAAFATEPLPATGSDAPSTE